MSALPALSFGALLRHHRLAAGLTQEQLAEHAGVSPRAIIALERGERRRPHRRTIQLLAEALHLTGRDVAILEQTAGYMRPMREYAEGAVDAQSSPFVGRLRELSAIDRSLANPRPAVLLFAGEPGIGKSRLLDEAATRGRARGLRVLQGGEHRRNGHEPYAPLPEILARSLDTLSSAHLRAALNGCGWLARLLPELAEIVSAPLPAGSLAPEQERRLIFTAVARYLSNVAGPSGTLLLLDDLQWASPDGLDLLVSLLRSDSGESIRIIGAYRDTEVDKDHPLSATLADLAEHGLAEQVVLEPLVDQEAVDLLDALLMRQTGTTQDDGARQEILRRAGGLPFFLVSYVLGLAAVPADGARTPSVPWNVAQSIRQRIAALSVETQHVLRAAALIGRAVERRVLLGMNLAAEPEILRSLDAACRARLLVLKGEREYQFTHDVIREVIEADLGSGERALLHRAVGEVLERLPEQGRRAGELAWHFLEADDLERALHHNLRAGEEAAEIFAHGEADRYYCTALHLAQSLADPVREAEALEKHGWIRWTVGRYDEALDALEEAAELQHRVGNRDAEGRIAAKLGWALSQAGKPEEGISRLQTTIGRLSAGGPSEALVELYNVLAHLYDRQGRMQDIVTAAERAAEAAHFFTDDRVRVLGKLNRGIALWYRDRFDDALEALNGVLPVAEAVGDSETLGRALIHVATAYTARGEFDRSRSYWERLVVLRQRTSSPERAAFALTLLAEQLVLEGEWGKARRHYERAAGLTSALASHQAGWVRLPFARLCLLEGRWHDADTYLQECMRVVERTGDRGSVPLVQAVLAERDLLWGRADAAVARLESLLDHFDLNHGELIVLAEGYVEMGNVERACELLEQGMGRATAQKHRLALAHWKLLQGKQMAREGHWEEAERALAGAISLASALPYPYATARALYESGRICLQQAQRGKARKHLKEAVAIFQHLGARPDTERTEQLLEELH